MFTKEQKRVILQIAKEAVKEAVLKRDSIDKESLLKSYLFLQERGAVFVTINEFNNLRGCIGSIVAHKSLLDDIVANAKMAALNDPRFNPISPSELDNLDIEVSILTPPKLLEYRDILDLKAKIREGIDGVILKYNNHQATYLPSVWEQLPTFESFFTSLCQKASLSGNCLDFHPQIYTYEAIKIDEESIL
jgi:AmmeMemoRadiSam system protein A